MITDPWSTQTNNFIFASYYAPYKKKGKKKVSQTETVGHSVDLFNDIKINIPALFSGSHRLKSVPQYWLFW